MSKIKFDCVKDGEIEHHIGVTLFSNLFLIGAFSLTSKINPETCRRDYPTDAEGLKSLESKASDAIESLSHALESLGVMLGSIDTTVVDYPHMNSYYWLIAGLSELIGILSNEQSDLLCTLRQINEAKIKELTEQLNGRVKNEL